MSRMFMVCLAQPCTSRSSPKHFSCILRCSIVIARTMQLWIRPFELRKRPPRQPPAHFTQETMALSAIRLEQRVFTHVRNTRPKNVCIKADTQHREAESLPSATSATLLCRLQLSRRPSCLAFLFEQRALITQSSLSSDYRSL